MRSVLALLLPAFLVSLPVSAEQASDGFAKAMELFHAGRYEASLPFFQRELDLAEASHGSDDPVIAASLNNLAEASRLAGQLDRAEELYRRALELDERAGRENDPEHAISLNNLAMVYRGQKRFDEAERLYVRSLNLLERSLGTTHPDVARSMNNLAMLYRLQGRPERARPMLEQALAVATEALGARNPLSDQLRRNLASLERPMLHLPKLKPSTVVVGAAPARVEPAAGGSFAVQVASVREPNGAEAEVKRLARRFPVLKDLEVGTGEKVEVPDKGVFYRVYAGSFVEEADALAVCAQLKAEGAYCRTMRR